MQYASYLNAVFFAVLTVLTVLVCLFGWRLGGYVERAHESQNWFFQNVSHELKTPMMAFRAVRREYIPVFSSLLKRPV